MGSKKGSNKTPYVDYHLSFHLGFCHGPVDALTCLKMKDKVVFEDEVLGGAMRRVDQPDLFGGNQREGGVAGDIYFLDGAWNQYAPAALAAKLGGTPTTVPGFRGISSLFFTGNDQINTRGFKVSANYPTVPSIVARMRRNSWPVGLDPSKAIIPNEYVGDDGEGGTTTKLFYDSNPAYVIWECLTNEIWGMGGNPLSLDMTSFQAAANTLYDENFGVSFLWTRQTTIEALIQEVLNHINGMFYFNPRTGKGTLKLLRKDYDLENSREFGPSNARLLSFSRKLWGETVNEIVVAWTNPVSEEEETVTYQSIGNIAMQGEVVSETRNYYMVRSARLASELAARDIVSASYPLATAQIEVDRRHWDILPGEVIRLSWPTPGYEIGMIPMRVMEVDYGEFSDSKIRVDLLEDVFALDAAEYIDPPRSEWKEPDQNPNAPVFRRPIPASFRAAPTPFVQHLPNFDLSDNNHPVIVVTSLVVKQEGQDDFLGYYLWKPTTDVFGNSDWTNLGEMTLGASAVLDSGITPEPRSRIRIKNFQGKNVRPEVGWFGFFDGGHESQDEMFIVSAVHSNDEISIERGVYDTVPHSWDIGAGMWFFPDSFMAFDTLDPLANTSINYRIQPRTSLGATDFEYAQSFTTTRPDRHYRPFRPANFKVDGVAFGTSSEESNHNPRNWTINVTWSNRHRMNEDMIFRKWDEGPTAPEPGQTTALRVNETAWISGLEGNSHSIPVEETGQSEVLFIEGYSERDDFQSIQAHSVTKRLYAKGYGFDYGYFFGGWPNTFGDMK